MLRDSPGVVQSELEGRQRCRRGCVLASFFKNKKKKKKLWPENKNEKGDLERQRGGATATCNQRRLTRCEWSTGASLREKTILTDRRNKGATAAAPLSAGITVSAACLPRRDLCQSREISCELQAVRVGVKSAAEAGSHSRC